MAKRAVSIWLWASLILLFAALLSGAGGHQTLSWWFGVVAAPGYVFTVIRAR